jgi:hypothetical protein
MRRAFVGAAALALLGSNAASAGRPARGSTAPTGDHDGLALLLRVHHAYAGAPAVAVSGRVGTLSFRFTLVLSSGIAIAEQFVGREPSRTTTLVARRGGPTFAREPGSSCWRTLRSSDPQAFENLGLHFPDQPAMTVRAPQPTSAGWLLPVVVDGDPGTFSIDRSSAQVRSITVGAGGHRIVEHVTVLQSVPHLSTAEPRC